jgi:hypothetical protein
MSALKLWASKLLTPEVEVMLSSEEEISLSLATFRAFRELTLLPDNANQKELVDYYDGLYADFGRDYSIEYAYIQPPMSEEFGPVQLYHAFRRAYKTAYKELDMSLWGLYDLVDFNLPVSGVVRALVTGGEDNAYSESGLYLTSLVFEKQIKEGKRKIAKFDKANAGLKAAVLDPVGYIILNSIRLELGLSPLDMRTATKFIDSRKREIGSYFDYTLDDFEHGYDYCHYRYVPLAQWLNGVMLNFGRSAVEEGYCHEGVRFSVSKKVQAHDL